MIQYLCLSADSIDLFISKRFSLLLDRQLEISYTASSFGLSLILSKSEFCKKIYPTTSCNEKQKQNMYSSF